MTLQTAKALKRLLLSMSFVAVAGILVFLVGLYNLATGASTDSAFKILELGFISVILLLVCCAGLSVCIGAEQCSIQRKEAVSQRLERLLRPKASMPRSLQDRSKYLPHMGRRPWHGYLRTSSNR